MIDMRWRMNDERWRMKDEAWRMKDVMKDEGWEMKDERWRREDERWSMKDEGCDEGWRMRDEGWDEGWEMKIDYSTSIMPEMLTARRPTPDWHLNETCLLFTGLGEDEGWRMRDEGWKWDEGWELAAYLNDTIKNGRVQLRLTAQHNNYTTVYSRRHRGANTKSPQWHISYNFHRLQCKTNTFHFWYLFPWWISSQSVE